MRSPSLRAFNLYSPSLRREKRVRTGEPLRGAMEKAPFAIRFSPVQRFLDGQAVVYEASFMSWRARKFGALNTTV